MTRLSLLFALSSGCVHLAGLSVTPVPADRTVPVSAEAETKLLFLGMSLRSDFADDLTTDLMRQCEGGTVTGILTKHEVHRWGVVTRRRVVANGWCVR